MELSTTPAEELASEPNETDGQDEDVVDERPEGTRPTVTVDLRALWHRTLRRGYVKRLTPSPWFRCPTNVLFDPRTRALNDRTYRFYVSLIALASEQPEVGVIDYANAMTLATDLGIPHDEWGPDVGFLNRALGCLQVNGLIDWGVEIPCISGIIVVYALDELGLKPMKGVLPVADDGQDDDLDCGQSLSAPVATDAAADTGRAAGRQKGFENVARGRGGRFTRKSAEPTASDA